MRVVYMAHPVSSPTPEGVVANLARAKRWYRWIITTFHVAVLADWVLTCEVLDDAKPSDRRLGMSLNVPLIRRCDEIWLVGGRLSNGMLGEREEAVKNGLVVQDLTLLLGEEPPGPAQVGTMLEKLRHFAQLRDAQG